MANPCDECVYYDYDQEEDVRYCTMHLDEDEMERFLRGRTADCPFYLQADDLEPIPQLKMDRDQFTPDNDGAGELNKS